MLHSLRFSLDLMPTNKDCIFRKNLLQKFSFNKIVLFTKKLLNYFSVAGFEEPNIDDKSVGRNGEVTAVHN